MNKRNEYLVTGLILITAGVTLTIVSGGFAGAAFLLVGGVLIVYALTSSEDPPQG